MQNHPAAMGQLGEQAEPLVGTAEAVVGELQQLWSGTCPIKSAIVIFLEMVQRVGSNLG